MNNQEIEFGLDTPVFVTVDESGQPLSGDVVIANTAEEAVLADTVSGSTRSTSVSTTELTSWTRPVT